MLKSILSKLPRLKRPLKRWYSYELEVPVESHQRIQRDMIEARNATLSEHLSACVSMYSKLLQASGDGAKILVRQEDGETWELSIRTSPKGRGGDHGPKIVLELHDTRMG